MTEDRQRLVATDDSLDLSEAVADGLGIPFERDTVRAQANNLMQLYYKDIASVLVRETRNCQFESFALRRFAAYSDPIGDQSLILIDEQWPMFFWDANLLVCLRTFIALGEVEREETNVLFNENLLSFRDPSKTDSIKDKLRPYILRYKSVLPLVNLLTMCMLGFVICHEIAHAIHEHSSKPQLSEIELEADATGFQLLTRVCCRFENLKSFTVPPNMICAPVMAFKYLEAIEDLNILKFTSAQYPSFKQRVECLKGAFAESACDNGIYLFNGLMKGLSDLLDSSP